VRWWAGEKALDETAGRLWPEERVPGIDDAHGIDDAVGRVGLEEEPGRASAQRFVDVFIEAVGGEHEYPRAGAGFGEPAGRLDAVEHRHADVHHHDPGLERFREGDRFGAIRCFADDPHVWLGLQDGAQAGAHDGLVVGEQDVDHDAVGK
jgi:hypothetical protein